MKTRLGLLVLAALLPQLAFAQDDDSLTPQEYVALGCPALKKTWLHTDYKALAEGLHKLALSDPKKLPRRGSSRSGEYFSRMVEVKNLEILKDAKASPQKRMGLMLGYMDGYRGLTKIYQSALQQRCPVDYELAGLMGFGFEVLRLAFEIATEFKKGFKPDDPSYAARMSGYRRMQSGLVTMVLGCFVTIEENSFRPGAVRLLVSKLQRSLPGLIPYLPATAKAALRKRITELAKRNAKDADLNRLARSLQALLGPAEDPAREKSKPPAGATTLEYIDRRNGIRVEGLPPFGKVGQVVIFMSAPRTADPANEGLSMVFVMLGGEKKTLPQLEKTLRERGEAKKLKLVSRRVFHSGGVEVREIETQGVMAGRAVRSTALLAVHQGNRVQVTAAVYGTNQVEHGPLVRACLKSLRLFSTKALPKDLEQLPAKGPGRLIDKRLGFSLNAPQFPPGPAKLELNLQMQGKVSGFHCMKVVSAGPWTMQSLDEYVAIQRQKLATKGMFVEDVKAKTWRGLPSCRFEVAGSRLGKMVHGLGFVFRRQGRMVHTMVLGMNTTKKTLRRSVPGTGLGTTPLE